MPAAKHAPVRRYATGGQIPRSGKTDMWIDNIPVDQYALRSSGDRKLEIKPRSPNDDIVTGPQPEGTPTYMEHRKGGKVNRVMKKPVKGYQRGGEVKDTAPGAASASSRPWSANIAGRNVAVHNKGGKVNKTLRGKR